MYASDGILDMSQLKRDIDSISKESLGASDNPAHQDESDRQLVLDIVQLKVKELRLKKKKRLLLEELYVRNCVSIIMTLC